jgi:5-methyltetrahydropteroyltriglutamate--homocysteine methyltransferase
VAAGPAREAGELAAPRRPARAEVIGSLLRPPRLLDALSELYAPGHLMAYADDRARDRSHADGIADEEIRRVVARQVDAGLDVVTDGEFRRLLYTNSLQDAIDGFTPGEKGRTFRAPTGEVFDTPPLPVASARLRKVGSPAARDAEFLRSLTAHPFKVTLPAGSWFMASETFVPGVTDRFYGSPAELFEDVLAILRELIGDAIAAGARYIQLDFPRYVHLIDEAPRQALRNAGVDLDEFLERSLDADRRVIEGFPDEVTFGLHICRGNFRSAWLFNGSLEPLAERIFNELPYDVFLVEWEDTDREGDYAPLRHVPPGPIVALGAVSSKTGELESEDAVVRALDEASRHLDLDQLALSTQCGFASEAVGNYLTEEEQWRKLDLIGSVATRVWG